MPKHIVQVLYVGAFLAFVVGLFVAERRTKVVSRYLAETDSPVTLAIARFVAFACLLAFSPSFANIRLFSGLPKNLQYPPLPWARIAEDIPISPEIVDRLYPLFALSCVLAALGLFTRVSAWAATLLGLYLLGIPQFYGKVNHYSHLLWFAALMAVAPCADVLSFDAVRKAWRRADAGDTAPPEPSRAYALPLRLLWVLLGVLYFFPGLTKLVIGGGWWLSGKGFMFHTAAKWHQLNWRFPIAFERIPGYAILAGDGAVFFEITFVVFLLSRRTRWFSAAMALAFHNLTLLTMQIGFFFLQPFYLTFLNWPKLFYALGKRLFPRRLTLVYDGTCKLCRRTVATLRAFDVLGRVDWIASTEADRLREAGLDRIADEGWLEHFTAVTDGQESLGYEAYRKLAPRIPALWAAVPFLGLPGVSHLGRAIYERVAGSRTCDFRKPSPPAAAPPPARPALSTGVVLMGLLLVGANALLGAAFKYNAWPFSCYPPFVDWSPPRYIVDLTIETTPAGQSRPAPIDQDAANLAFGSERWAALVGRTIATRDPERLTSLWKVFRSLEPQMAGYRVVDFYQDDYAIDPNDLSVKVASRRKLAAITQDEQDRLSIATFDSEAPAASDPPSLP